MFEVLHAGHRKAYFKLAFKYWVSPQHVWDLAHGGHAQDRKDRDILHDLVEMKIVHRHKHHSHSIENTDDDDD